MAESTPISATILVVDDDTRTRCAMAELLRDEGHAVETACDGQDAIEKIQFLLPDIVLADLEMPRCDGLELLRTLRDGLAVDIPFIFVSGHDEPGTQAAGLNLGADDYLTKPVDFEQLLARINARLRRSRSQRYLVRCTITDALTGILNRRGFVIEVERGLDRCKRGAELSVLMIDLDRFKDINDTYGHGAGDNVLRAMADSLSAAIRVVDRVGRLGGDEFVVLLADASAHAASSLADRIREMPVFVVLESGEPVSVEFSLGLTTACVGDTVDSLLNRADTAMYRNKLRRRNRAGHQSHRKPAER